MNIGSMQDISKVPFEADAGGDADIFNLRSLLTLLRLRWPLILGSIVTCLLLGGAYIFTAVPQYTASAALLIDSRRPDIFKSQAIVDNTPLDSTDIDSQVEIIRSEKVVKAVADTLDLYADPEFSAAAGGFVGSLIGTVRSLIGYQQSIEPEADETKVSRVLARLKSNLVIGRLGRTFVLTISFTSPDRGKAARIANAFADAYIVDQLDAKFQVTRRSGEWLQERLQELRTQVRLADVAVQDYKAKNEIVDTGNGMLVNEQQLAQLVGQLVTARASTAEAKARLDRIEEINSDNLTDAVVTDVLSNPIITRLRGEYLDSSRKASELEARYGPQHIAVSKLREEMANTEAAMHQELGRIEETYKSDYDIARARELSLNESLAGLVRGVASTNQAQVDLRELEAAASLYRNIYDAFRSRYLEATQQQSFPVSEARIITGASAPSVPSAPKKALSIAIAGMLGLILGVTLALAREALDRVFRTPGRVEQVLGVNCLGVLPLFSSSVVREPEPATAEDIAEHRLPRALGASRYVIDEPFSRYTETIRSIKVSIDVAGLVRETKVIGVISALPGEGKSTIAANLAELMAHVGHKTILLDIDLRNPTVTRRLTPKAKSGLLEVLHGTESLSKAAWHDPVTDLSVLPAVLQSRIFHSAEVVSSPSMVKLLNETRTSYEYVVLDLPPLAPVVDVRAMAHLVDAFILVVEWGRTTHDAVQEILASSETVRSKLLGIVLNKANVNVLKRLETYKGKSYKNYYYYGGNSAKETV